MTGVARAGSGEWDVRNEGSGKGRFGNSTMRLSY